MAELAMENIYDILSRIPVKSLARFRCVSKLWRNYIDDPHLESMHSNRADPMLIMFHHFPTGIGLNSSCTLSFLEYNEQVQVRKKPQVMEFMCGDLNHRYQYSCNDDVILGSCNGLLYLSHYKHDTGIALLVIHPLRKECYVLPPIKRPLRSWRFDIIEFDEHRHRVESTGLGFDNSTNTFKMVAVVKPIKHPLYAVVHVLGTDSWRKITQIPSCPITSEGVYANGCLHWFEERRIIISFDMANEEFGSINPPRETPYANWTNGALVNLHGQLGYVHYMRSRISELWVLKESGWVMHCKLFTQLSPLRFNRIKVLGFCNENGDLLIADDDQNNKMYVYNLKSESFSLVGQEEGPRVYFRLYQSSLFSTRYSIKN